MRILFVSSELAPLAKSGGLADVVSALPQALRQLGHDARVIMPLYKQIKNAYMHKLKFLSWSMTKLGWRSMYCGLFSMEVKGVPVYFIDNEYYFGHDGIYLDYAFDIERFSFFQRAVLDCLGERLDFAPQILHLNDWQTAMIPLLLEAHYQTQGYFQDLCTVYTIHNLKYQGVHGREKIQDLLDLGDEYMREDCLLQDGVPNFMKAGIVYSNRITTVSPSYASEILTDYYGEGLNYVLQQYEWKLKGILNALDTDSYNPQTDSHLAKNYSERNWRKGKAANKLALQAKYGLREDADIPVYIMLSRLVSQKGIDLFMCIADELLQEDIQILVMGTGDYLYEDALRKLESRHPAKMRAIIDFNEAASRLLYAGGDVFLMPSIFEPCGLSQMIAMRYGTLPLVRETGGLRDTVAAYNHYDGSGNGFSFMNINAHELLFTCQHSLDLYHRDQAAWGRLVRRGLQGDFSWKKSAKDYLAVYRDVLEENGLNPGG